MLIVFVALKLRCRGKADLTADIDRDLLRVLTSSGHQSVRIAGNSKSRAVEIVSIILMHVTL